MMEKPFDYDEWCSYIPFEKQALQAPNLIYGAGNFGKRVCRALRQHNLPVIGFLDQRAKPGLDWDGVPIYPPDWEGRRSEVNVLIALHNREVALRPVVSYLQRLGYTKIILPMQFYDVLGDAIGDAYWLGFRTQYAALQQEIEAGDALWADAASRDSYRAVLRFRVQGDLLALPVLDVEGQYFPSDLPAWPSPIRYVDCGAYVGDTLSNARRLGMNIESAMLFEPDLRHFATLIAYLRQEWNIPVFGWPCAVSNCTTRLHFAADGAEGGRVAEDGAVVYAVALDDVLQGYAPTLIKMDIEGAEMLALKGAQRLIEAHRPGLAICTYHSLADLWQVGALLQGWQLGYRFYLRMHGQNTFETVLYALSGA